MSASAIRRLYDGRGVAAVSDQAAAAWRPRNPSSVRPELPVDHRPLSTRRPSSAIGPMSRSSASSPWRCRRARHASSMSAPARSARGIVADPALDRDPGGPWLAHRPARRRLAGRDAGPYAADEHRAGRPGPGAWPVPGGCRPAGARRPSRPVTLSAERDGASLRLTVSDRGIGIPAPEVERVFRKYYRAPPSRSNWPRQPDPGKRCRRRASYRPHAL